MNLSQLMQNVYRDLGKIAGDDEFLATGGGTTTIINTEVATRKRPYKDNYAYGWTAFVVRDAGGASAAPENEFARISNYASSTQTFTIGTITTAVATGDTVAIANDDIPLRTMIELANRMLKDLGRIELIDTSLTTAAEQTEYALPTAAKYSVRRVEVQTNDDTNDNAYEKVYVQDIVPAAPNSTGLLVIPQFDSGYTIKLWYEGVHPTLTAYSSVISETIDDHIAIAGLTAYALQWYNGTIAGEDQYWYDREQRAWETFERAKNARPVKKSSRVPKFFNIGS